jgi:hypothetical protein
LSEKRHIKYKDFNKFTHNKKPGPEPAQNLAKQQHTKDFRNFCLLKTVLVDFDALTFLSWNKNGDAE